MALSTLRLAALGSRKLRSEAAWDVRVCALPTTAACVLRVSPLPRATVSSREDRSGWSRGRCAVNSRDTVVTTHSYMHCAVPHAADGPITLRVATRCIAGGLEPRARAFYRSTAGADSRYVAGPRRCAIAALLRAARHATARELLTARRGCWSQARACVAWRCNDGVVPSHRRSPPPAL